MCPPPCSSSRYNEPGTARLTTCECNKTIPGEAVRKATLVTTELKFLAVRPPHSPAPGPFPARRGEKQIPCTQSVNSHAPAQQKRPRRRHSRRGKLHPRAHAGCLPVPAGGVARGAIALSADIAGREGRSFFLWLEWKRSRRPRVPKISGSRRPVEPPRPEICFQAHALRLRSTTPAAPAPHPSGKSFTMPGTISSPVTKSTIAAPWDHCVRMPPPPSAPSSAAAISPPGSPASTARIAATKSSSPSPARPATSAPPATSAASATPAHGSPPPPATTSRTGSSC